MLGTIALTEDQVIEGVVNFLYRKGRTTNRKVRSIADASRKQHGVDLHIKLADDKNQGNNYFIEAKGNLKSNGENAKSQFGTNFRWAISQIVLRMQVDSRRNNYIYGIAMPNSEIEKAVKMIENNWALSELKLRLYGAYTDEDGVLFAIEYSPRDIYKKFRKKP